MIFFSNNLKIMANNPLGIQINYGEKFEILQREENQANIGG
jgi:hypothetical protein